MSQEEKQPAAPPAEAQPGKGPSRAEVKAQRQAAKLAEQQAAQKAKEAQAAQFSDIFGKAPLICSKTVGSKVFTEVPELTPQHVGQIVNVRARLHNVRKQSKIAFIILRKGFSTIQCILSVADGLPKEILNFVANIPIETIVDVEATVTVPQAPVASTTMSMLELVVRKLFIVSEAPAVLPFVLEDASRPESAEGATVNFDTRLGCRWLDLRTPASNAIFRMQSKVGQYFREFLTTKSFIEIHSPKIIGAASEGGANVFKLDYFGKPAFLAQSPQLYKQMVLQGDLERVFEVAPVFRAEDSFTHRHLTEFVGLDIEMVIKEHYYEVLNMAEEVFQYIFQKLATCTAELDAVNRQYPFTPFVFQMTPEAVESLGVGVIESNLAPKDQYGARVRNREMRMLRLPFPAAIALLNTVVTPKLSELEDIDTTSEKRLGALVKERYGVDFYICDRYPATARPFYTMPAPDDNNFSNSFDMFIRCEEISSGAQRIHDPELLTQRCIAKGVRPDSVKDYIDSFRLGAWPHGGFGVGLERVVMLYLGLKNIRFATLFPRDPKRCTP